MYNSVVKWANLKVECYSFISVDSAGDLLYDAKVDLLGYIGGDIKVVQNESGRVVESHKQLYIKGKYNIKEGDKFIFENKEHVVMAIAPFYSKGRRNIWVVYL